MTAEERRVPWLGGDASRNCEVSAHEPVLDDEAAIEAKWLKQGGVSRSLMPLT